MSRQLIILRKNCKIQTCKENRIAEDRECSAFDCPAAEIADLLDPCENCAKPGAENCEKWNAYEAVMRKIGVIAKSR